MVDCEEGDIRGDQETGEEGGNERRVVGGERVEGVEDNEGFW